MTTRPAAARTAFGPMVIAATEQYTPAPRRVLHDDLAVRFLPPGMRFIVRACRWRFLRRLLVAATERTAPGTWGGMLCRKRYADDQVTEAVAAGIGQVVILGAGFDTRAYRLVAPAGARAFEVDLPVNTADKQRRVQAVLGDPERVRLVPVDFETDDLGTALAGHGYSATEPALFVWEGVTQYLAEGAVRSTFTHLAGAAPGSRLIVTYVRQDFLDGTDLHGSGRMRERMVGKYGVWHFGIAPEEVGALLREYGWEEREQVGSAEYTARYLRPADRRLPVSEVERFVLAEKP